MNDYIGFRDMLNGVCRKLAVEYSPIGLSYSGGLDSTAVALGLCNSGEKFFLIHINQFYDTPNGGQWNKIWEDHMCYEFSQQMGIPILFIPVETLKDGITNVYHNIGIKTVLTADGMDRCYGNSHVGWDATFGEDFHCLYPLLDKLFRTIPRRIKGYKNVYNGVDEQHDCHIRDADRQGITWLTVSTSPVFIDFFKRYHPNVKDIVFPKQLTFEFVKNNLGISYYGFCKNVYKKYRSVLLPMWCRLIERFRLWGELDNG